METESTTPVLICENCSSENPADKKFCSQCRFPFGGTEEEKRSFRLIVSSRKRLLSDARDKIKSAKIIIYVLAGLFALFGLIAGFIQDDFVTMIVNLVLSVLFLIFAAWCQTNPFGAILTAFIIYITVQVINAFEDPTTLYSGVIFKIFFIAAFIKGIRSAQEARNYLNELEKFKSVPVDYD